VVDLSAITLSMLPDPEAAEVVFPRLLVSAGPGKALIDCATLRAADMAKMSEAWTAAGGRFLEAPVSGSKGPAAAGQLVFLTAGDESLYQDATTRSSTATASMLGAMGKRSFFFGDATGQGTRMKLVVNKMMVEMMATLGEGIELAGRAGLPQSQLVDVLAEGAMANPMFGLKGPKIIADDHEPHFPLKHARKDLLFGLELAEELGQSHTDMGSAAKQVIARAVAESPLELLEDDFSALTKGFQG
jgi:3-hydroxyisobutyrate dehydrogenase-like beta-hydroxyacid dehydrogenase